MPRIPDSELARLKSEISVEQLARARGVKLIRKGADLHGRCPFHDDRTPSLVITPEKNLWHCLGACQTGGTVLDWVQKAEGVSFRHAVELLRADLPKLSDSSTPIVRTSTKKKLPKLASSDAEGQALLRRVAEHYRQTMQDDPAAQDYLASRGLTHPELLEHFHLGYANRTLGYRLPDANRQEGAALRGKLRDLGVLRKSGHEHLTGSLVVPLHDAAGNVVQLYGRKVRSDLRKGTALHLYLPGPQRGVLNRAGLEAAEEVILCESILDALTFWSAGLTNVTTTYGTSGLTEDLRQALKAASTKRVLIAYDRDEAGEKAAKKVAGELNALGLAAYRIQFPKGMDANEYAQKVQPATKSLAAVVRAALWMGEGEAPARPAPQEPSKEPRREDVPGVAGLPDKASKEEGGEGREPLDAPPEPAPPHEKRPTSPDTPTNLLPLEALPDPAPPAPPPAPVRRLPPHVPIPELVARGEDLWMEFPECAFRVRGFAKNHASPEGMKVNLLVTPSAAGPLDPGALHVDTLDLQTSSPRRAYGKAAAKELGVSEETMKRRLGALLLALDAARARVREEDQADPDEAPEMSDRERDEAMDLLRDPRLLERLLEDFATCGVVGEEVNKLAGYLATTSRKFHRPLAIVVQSNSAAGKSSLMDAVLSFMPPEETVTYSAMTGQSLYYMSQASLRHRILAVTEEEGAQRASYALKLLQSEGQLTIASTGKDPQTGRLVTEDHHVEGPVMLFLTTTATDVDEELMNRCLVLTVDEGPRLTAAIHAAQRQRRTLAGRRSAKRKAAAIRRHRNAQRLLKTLWVVNPYADQLTFQIHQTRFRRDHEKYLTLIEAVAFLHQYQREVKSFTEDGETTHYIQVTPWDIAVANELAQEVLGQSVDELPPQTRRVLEAVTDEVQRQAKEHHMGVGAVRFTRRQVREWTGLGASQVQVHLRRLEDLEYVLVHSGSRGKSIVYELLHEAAAEGTPQFPGLLDMEVPDTATTSSLPGLEANLPDTYRPQTGPKPVGCRTPPDLPETRSLSLFLSSLVAERRSSLENASQGETLELSPVVPARKANGSRHPAGREDA